MNEIESPIIITDKIYRDFEVFLKEYEINYKLPGEKDLNKLKTALRSQDDLKKITNTSISVSYTHLTLPTNREV